jgi:hypothetical protein
MMGEKETEPIDPSQEKVSNPFIGWSRCLLCHLLCRELDVMEGSSLRQGGCKVKASNKRVALSCAPLHRERKFKLKN